MKSKHILYFHGGSGNHGCEALVRTIVDICNLKNVSLYSKTPEEDKHFGLEEIIDEIKLSKLDTSELEESYNSAISYSIGGDNYSCLTVANWLKDYNTKLKQKGVKTTLIGCSIDEDLFNYESVIDDLKNYDLITARETITYNNLIKHGINARLIPDSAFTLKTEYLELPDGFMENNTIGINLSSLVQGLEKDKGIVYENYKNLIDHIISNTNYKIALIPHVIQSFNDDMQTLTSLYNEYKDTGRVILIDNCNCMQLKGFIARCRIFIGARTHSSIASYSSCVPTIVTGYSIKSIGIARDIFGTDENYVVPIQNLKTTDDLKNSFIWLENNYTQVKQHLDEFMPSYIAKCYELKDLVDKL